MSAPFLSLTGISKAFFGAPALTDVSLDIGRGRVLGLVGQNGAGKSTLMNILGGVFRPDAGTMRLDGEPYAPARPGDASARGIAFVHQELNFFTNLSIAENIFIDAFPRRAFGPLSLVDAGALRQKTGAFLEAVGLAYRPDTPVANLSPGERQLVEVAKALRLAAEVIIFDEPTTSLTARETARLFALLRDLQMAGKTILYISHILPDVLAIADDIAVLRDGRVVGHGAAADFSVSRMITLMLGRGVEQLYPARTAAPAAEVLFEASHLTTRGVLNDVSFELHRGEVLGLFGLMGSGRTEVARTLFGLDPSDSGEIVAAGRRGRPAPPRTAIRRGLSFITENRREEGLMMDVPVSDNIALTCLSRFAWRPFGWLDQGQLSARVADLAQALRIKSGPIGTQPVRSLSGGNQQKVVIAKWLLAKPHVFVLDEPTRGIDVGSKIDIYTMIDDLAAGGGAVLFISSEIEELLAMCDRLLVMSRGEIVAEFARPAYDREAILRAAFREQETTP